MAVLPTKHSVFDCERDRLLSGCLRNKRAAEKENLHVHHEPTQIIGFTGNDAEAYYTPNGTLVVTISVATKESSKDADGKWQSRTD